MANELENPAAALNVVSRITRSLKNLKDMPGIGSPLSSTVPAETPFPFETNYRTLVCGSYPAFYRYEDRTVFVDRILYGRRDYLRILFPGLAKQDETETQTVVLTLGGIELPTPALGGRCSIH